MKNNGIFETNVIMNFLEEINRRRTFGIVSHPDAGKTTLTEKLLLFGGAIQEAGVVKSQKISNSFWLQNIFYRILSYVLFA